MIVSLIRLINGRLSQRVRSASSARAKREGGAQLHCGIKKASRSLARDQLLMPKHQLLEIRSDGRQWRRGGALPALEPPSGTFCSICLVAMVQSGRVMAWI